MTGEDVTPHLRGSKDEGRNDGWNPAVAKVEDSEPGDALHGDDVGQVEKEEELVALEQVHVLSGLPQGPEVLGDLGLLSQSTRRSQPPSRSRGDQSTHLSPRGARLLGTVTAAVALYLPGPGTASELCVCPQPVQWQRKDFTQNAVHFV